MFIPRKVALVMWATASIFYAFQYIMRVMPNIMMPDLMNQFHMNTSLFGQYSGIYYIGYVLMHLPIGILLDRVGPRKVMTGCMLLISFGLLPIIISDNWIFPVVGRFLIGMGSSAAILGVFKIIRMSFAEARFSRMLGFSVTIGLFGAIYGGGPVAQMSEVFGYKAVVEIFVAFGILLALVTYLIVPNVKANHKSPMFLDIKSVFTNQKFLIICFCSGLLVGPMEGFADVWGAEYLKLAYGLDMVTTGYLTSLIYVGMCFGGPVLGFIAEKSSRYLESIIGAGCVMALVFVALLIGLLTLESMTIGFIAVGIACFYQVLAIYKASTYVPEQVVGLATAVANMIIMSFGYIFHSLIGSFIQFCGGRDSAQAFTYGLYIIPFALVLGVLGLVIFFIQEKRSLQQRT